MPTPTRGSFNDTHLLRKDGDADDAGDEEDLKLAVVEDEESEEGEQDEAQGIAEDVDASSVGRAAGEGLRGDEDEDEGLQAALAASMLPAATTTTPSTTAGVAPPVMPAEDEGVEEEELRTAIALSMARPS